MAVSLLSAFLITIMPASLSLATTEALETELRLHQLRGTLSAEVVDLFVSVSEHIVAEISANCAEETAGARQESFLIDLYNECLAAQGGYAATGRLPASEDLIAYFRPYAALHVEQGRR